MTWTIDTSIPYGNACDTFIEHTQDGVDMSFSADPHGGLEALWFCFRLHSNGQSLNKPIRFILKNPQNTLAGEPWTRFRPVIRTASTDWERLPFGTQMNLPDGRVNIMWAVTLSDPWIDVAFCYPYGMPNIKTLCNDTNGYWKQDTIGVTQAGRSIIRLSNHYGQPAGTQKGLYLIARQHAGETPGSWMLDGFLRYMAEHPEQAPLIWCIPLANRDGVEDGDYGKDPYPRDLNRAWQRPFRQSMRFEIQCIERDIALWSNRCQPTLSMDFHAPGGTEDDGIYAYIINEFHFRHGHLLSKIWADRMGHALKEKYSAPIFTRTTNASNFFSRWGTEDVSDRSAEYMWQQHSVPLVATETTYAMCGDVLMTREAYQDSGALIAQSVANHLSLDKS